MLSINSIFTGTFSSPTCTAEMRPAPSSATLAATRPALAMAARIVQKW